MIATLPAELPQSFYIQTMNPTTNLPEDLAVSALASVTSATSTVLPVVQIMQGEKVCIDSGNTADAGTGTGKVINVKRTDVGTFLVTFTPTLLATRTNPLVVGQVTSIRVGGFINVSGTLTYSAKAFSKFYPDLQFRLVKAETTAGVPLVQTDAYSAGMTPPTTAALQSLTDGINTLNGAVETHAQFLTDIAGIPAATAQIVLQGMVFNGDCKVEPITNTINGVSSDFLKITPRTGNVFYIPVVLTTDKKAIISSGLKIDTVPTA